MKKISSFIPVNIINKSALIKELSAYIHKVYPEDVFLGIEINSIKDHTLIISCKNSSIATDTKEILLEQYYENLVRLSMELEDFEKGDVLIKENQLGSARYHDVAGDFYKHFQDNEMANYHYDLAISFDMDESQKNLIKLKKPLK